VAAYALIEAGRRNREDWELGNAIVLVSSDGERVTVPSELIDYSNTLHDMHEETGERELPLNAIDGATLRRIVRLLEIYHANPRVAYLEYDAAMGTPESTIGELLAIVAAINYLDMVETGALDYAFTKILRMLTPENALATFDALLPEMLDAFLTFYAKTTQTIIAIALDSSKHTNAISAGLAGILTAQEPKASRVNVVAKFLGPTSLLSVRMFTEILDQIVLLLPATTSNPMAYTIVFRGYAAANRDKSEKSLMQELGQLLMFDTRPPFLFAEWLLENHHEMVATKILDFIDECFGGFARKASGPETMAARIRLTKLAISKYLLLLAPGKRLELVCNRLIHNIYRMPQYFDGIEQVLAWLFDTYTDKIDYMGFVRDALAIDYMGLVRDALARADQWSGHDKKHSIRLLKLLTPRMQQQLDRM
jgi:hypothetical protein